jgi:hypothetical protein
MDEHQKENSTRGAALIAFAVAIALLAILTWGPWNVSHVAINDGPSGTPGSTVKEGPPPPAAGPSESTVGSSR